MKRLLLICGAPGSGKTTEAKGLLNNGAYRYHFEADMFFETAAGYKFNRDDLPKAHGWCQSVVNEAMKSGEGIIVSNTFTKAWERKPYLDMARENGYKVTFYHLGTQYGNIHGVPDAVVERMVKNFEYFTQEEIDTLFLEQ